jgi:hypothetical protein
MLTAPQIKPPTKPGGFFTPNKAKPGLMIS